MHTLFQNGNFTRPTTSLQSVDGNKGINFTFNRMVSSLEADFES